MNGRRLLFTYFVCLLLLIGGCRGKDESKEGPTPAVESGATISGVRWEARKDDGSGTLYVQTSDGKELLVGEGAIDSWFSQDRRTLYHAYRHGKSGYEREGMGLKRFSPDTGASDLVFDHDLNIVSVREVTTKKGRTAIIVEMTDGGRGAPEFAVADPERGRVFTAEKSVVISAEDGVLVFGQLTDEQIDESESGNRPAPSKSEELDLDELLGREATRETPNPIPND